MTKQEWLAEVQGSKADLLSLVEVYHPASHRVDARKSERGVLITAPSVEVACRSIRENIAHEEIDLAQPQDRFLAALKQENWKTIYSLLDSAWFGVPESTECWQIKGFAKAVDLLDDPPEDVSVDGERVEEEAF